MKLITELNEHVTVLAEEKNGKKELYIEGVFLQGDIENKNSRVYPMPILDKEVTRYVREAVEMGRAFGELGHPEGPGINLERVSHMITSLNKEGSNYNGKAKIMEGTPYGKIVYEMLNNGAQLGVSSRGVGSISTRDNVHYVNEDFKLATAADIVADPSAPDAFVQGIMEGAEWVFESGIWKQSDLEYAKNVVKQSSIRHMHESKIRAWKHLFDKM